MRNHIPKYWKVFSNTLYKNVINKNYNMRIAKKHCSSAISSSAVGRVRVVSVRVFINNPSVIGDAGGDKTVERRLMKTETLPD